MVYSNESRPSPPRTFFCYWDWCRLTFTAVDDLASHVRHDHIRTLQPMNKQEIMRMRKWDAEEAQSMLDSSGHSVLVSHHKGASPHNLPVLKLYIFPTYGFTSGV